MEGTFRGRTILWRRPFAGYEGRLLAELVSSSDEVIDCHDLWNGNVRQFLWKLWSERAENPNYYCTVAIFCYFGPEKLQWSQYHKMSLTKVIRYVSGVTTIFLGSPLDPWGPWGTRGGPRESNWNLSKSKNFANKSCQVCFRGDKKCIWSHPWPPGIPGALGVASGSNWNLIKSKYFANKICYVCFKGDKNEFRVNPWSLGSSGASCLASWSWAMYIQS